MATKKQVKDWINGGWKKSPFAKKVNGVRGLDVDGLYGFQCKDEVNAYSIWLGHPFKPGNAESLWRLKQSSFWTKIPNTQKPKRGDVFVMWYSAGGKEYGHTGIVRSGWYPGYFVSLDQNWFNSSLSVGSPPKFVKHKKLPKKVQYGIRGYLRPKLKK